ncbi:MAG: hypothetical protein U0223_09195 [Nitrospira sp.]
MDAKQKAMVAGSLILVWAGLAVSQWNLLEEPARVPLTNITGPAIGGRQSEGRGGLACQSEVARGYGSAT